MDIKKYLLKKITPNKPRKIRLIKKLFLDKDSFFVTTGFYLSFLKRVPCRLVDNKLVYLPWLNLPIIAFLDQRIRKSHKLFEFGCGYSTLYFSNLAKNVVSVENNLIWFNRISKMLMQKDIQNVSIIHKELSNGYAKCIKSFSEEFDIIFVDGRHRVDCIKNSIGNLSSQGVIILDDAERNKYSNGCDFLQKNGFRRLDFWGLKLGATVFKPTTIFYKDNNCLGL